ncbi:hypothetical protein [Planktothrix mougeotii]|nr:hypothetical protein [Planktothrix mougeotii]
MENGCRIYSQVIIEIRNKATQHQAIANIITALENFSLIKKEC